MEWIRTAVELAPYQVRRQILRASPESDSHTPTQKRLTDTVVGRALLQYFVEGICWASTFGLMGSSIMDLIRMVCGDIDEMSTTSNVIETLAMVSALS